jgi:hypothetical protein
VRFIPITSVVVMGILRRGYRGSHPPQSVPASKAKRGSWGECCRDQRECEVIAGR